MQSIAALGGTLMLSGIAGTQEAFTQESGDALVLASTVTPRGLDVGSDVSPGSISARGAPYEKTRHPTSTVVLREGTQAHAEKPEGMLLRGCLPERRAVSPDRRKAILKSSPQLTKVEVDYALLFNLDKPSPLPLKQQCKCVADGRLTEPEEPENDHSDFAPYKLARHVKRQTAAPPDCRTARRSPGRIAPTEVFLAGDEGCYDSDATINPKDDHVMLPFPRYGNG